MILPPRRPRIFSIPASVDFLPTLARALLDGVLVPGFAPRDPLELARATIYLPTRRACRLAREAFLDALATDGAILPRIVPLGDIDEDEFVFTETGAAGVLELPPTIGGLERRALLAQLILQWAASPQVRTGENAPMVAHSGAAALAFADDLARLMDDMTTRQVPWDRLDGLVPDKLDIYWQKALEFLKIAREVWPGILAERGAIEPADRRDRLIEAEADRLRTTHAGPVIVAGSTGSMPATAKLIATIAQLPHGAAVLPGLDTDLDEHSWRLLAGGDDTHPVSGHPQFAMQSLLTRMEATRGEVEILGAPPPHDRALLASEALRPAETTDQWQQRLTESDVVQKISAALPGLTVIEAANADEEALAIAVALRETLETPGKTAALVTPDRALARRVAAALARWNVIADDTGGDALAATQAGVFARLAATVALDGLQPVPLLALLKHPLFRLGREPGAWHGAVSALERAVLRGSRPRAGSGALAAALATARREADKLRRGEKSAIHRSDPRAFLTAEDFDVATELVTALSVALAPLEARASERAVAFHVLARDHAAILDALSATGSGGACFTGEDGAALVAMFDEIAALPASAQMTIAAADYGEMFETAAATRMVRRPGLPGARVRVYGLLEARLTHADRVILGGMIEGAWPPETRNDPWLSRPMRHTLGLDLPERRVGLAAHDFAQLLGAPEVMLTRAAKLAGAPTIASRFAQRLAAVAGSQWDAAVARGGRYLDMARTLDRPEKQLPPLRAPEPKPPVAARPERLSVTEIETWLRDPYAIYARHILRLRPLEPIDAPPGMRDRGTMIHDAVANFATAFKEKLPDDAARALIAFGEAAFEPLKDHPEARAFWWPRFCRVAQWFPEFEAVRRANVTKLEAEIFGTLKIVTGSRTFMLTARADRIEHLADGRFAIIDFKTGTPPSGQQVRSGLSPQLTLEGAILRAGGFEGIAAGASLAELVYVSLKGGEPAGVICDIKWKDSTPEAQADIARQRLTKLVEKFENGDQAYLSRVIPMFMRRYPGDYDHLARVKEWSLTGDADDEEGSVE